MKFRTYTAKKFSGAAFLDCVPDHWETKRLKYACTVLPSNVDKKSHAGESEVLLCNYTDVYYNEVISLDCDFMRATATADHIDLLTLRAGDTVITKDSETADDIAIAAYVPKDLPGVVCGYHLAIVRPNSAQNGLFIKRLFESDYLRAYFEVSARGLTRVSLPQYALKNVVIAIPTRTEQNAIAGFLDRETSKIDALIAEQEKLLRLLSEKREASSAQAVTRGITADVQLSQSGLSWSAKIPSHWTVIRLGQLFSQITEPGNHSLPILSVSIHSGVSDTELTDDEMDRSVTRSEDPEKYKRVEVDDLVYNMMRAWQGGFGTVAIQGMVSPAYVVARRQRGDVVTKFIELLLRTPNGVTEMKRYSRGVTDFRLRLYWDVFKNIVVALPALEEQQAIVHACEVLSQKIECL